MKLLQTLTAATLLITGYGVKAQPNCNYYLYLGDTAQYEACKLVEENIGKYYQFSREFHLLMDSAIAICPRFAYAYREKAAPYVKSGNFIEYMKNMELAVEHEPDIYLPIRASVRTKFFADHQGAIDDINLFLSTHSGDIPSSHNGTYHLLVVKALCYKNLNQPDSAIAILEELLTSEAYNAGMFDYLHLGVLYLETGKLEQALKCFDQQRIENNLAENEYYQALTLSKMQKPEDAKSHLSKAKELLKPGTQMHDPYHEMIDQIYWVDIERLEAKL